MGILIGVFVEEFVRGLTWVGDFAWGFLRGFCKGFLRWRFNGNSWGF